MMKFPLFILLVFMFSSGLYSQDKPDFVTIDKSTYRAWSEKRWHDLLDTCELAIDEWGIDYFYLRMRAGVAAFELHKYRKAIVHFEKALEFNSGDKDAMSLLVASMNNAGFTHNAVWLGADDRKRPGFFSSVYADYGMCNNPLYNDQKLHYNKPPVNRNLIMEKKLNGPFVYSSLYIENELSAKYQLMTGLSFLRMEGFSQMRFDNNTPPVSRIMLFENSYNVDQYGIYLGLVKYPDRSRVTTFFLHGFYIMSDAIEYTVNGAVLPTLPPMGSVPSPLTYYVKQDSSGFTLFEGTVGVTFKKNKTYTSGEWGLSVYASQEVKRLQLGYTFTFYPGARSGFASATSLYGLAGSGLSVVAKQSFWIRAGKIVSFEPYAMLGDIRYYSERSGTVIYNLPGTIRLKAGINMFVPLWKGCSLNTGYAFSQCTSQIIWKDFTGMTMGKPKFEETIENLNYFNHLIYGGLLWKF